MSFCTEVYGWLKSINEQPSRWVDIYSVFYLLLCVNAMCLCTHINATFRHTYTHTQTFHERVKGREHTVYHNIAATFLIRGAIQHFKITDLCRCAREQFKQQWDADGWCWMILHAKKTAPATRIQLYTLKDTPLAVLSEKSVGKMLRLVCIPFHLICGNDNDWNVFCHRLVSPVWFNNWSFFLEIKL